MQTSFKEISEYSLWRTVVYEYLYIALLGHLDV